LGSTLARRNSSHYAFERAKTNDTSLPAGAKLAEYKAAEEVEVCG